MSAKWFLPLLHKQAIPYLFVLLAAFSNVTNTTTAENTTTAPVGDREALLAIKSMITDDPQGHMTSWNDSSMDFCQWQGVTCSPRHQRVTILDLSSRGLRGSLSPFIGHLSFLKMIHLHNNSFSGEIPNEVGRLFRLQYLRLSNNSFEGNIPETVANCTNLQVLLLGYNKLVGRIPERIGSLSMLDTLMVHENVLEGGIPRFIGNLTLLETLSFFNCRLGGNIPDFFQRLNRLTRIALHGNNLVGNIPPSLYNLTLLERLILDNNSLTGRLPTNLGVIQPRLVVLSLADNQLTGPLPTSILSSPQISVLDVARNSLSGKLIITSRNSCNFRVISLSSNSFGSGDDDELEFIDDLSLCRELGILDLGFNQLRGFVPQSLGNLSNSLYSLSLASNGFLGSLPSSVGNLSGLTFLDVSSNQLTGSLPATISNLESLRRLYVQNNTFSGIIPDSFGNLSLILELDLSFNGLTGTIPLSLGNCQRLIRLNLERNSLTGFIPMEIFQLTSLAISLNLGSNQLSGQIPTNVGNLKSLTEIILANNRLSGELPSGLGSSSSLLNLNVSHNFFSGSLPTSLVSLRGLENLDVSSNNFTGKIPSYLEGILLETLNISFNDFDGEVPREGVFSNATAVSIVGNSRLCGGVPEFRLPKCRNSNSDKGLSLAVILVICIVSVLLFVAAMVLFFVCYRRKRVVEDDPPECLSRESLVQVSYEMLHKATDGFATKNFIGEGSFSSVYKGCPNADGVIVAIKVLNLQRHGGSKSFISECAALRNTRHRNLTKVITCCSGLDIQGNEFKAIVYEFMPNGSLDRWLHNVDSEFPQLTLLQRVCIALDVANALDYLHHHAGKTIVHCDLKPSNILLDEDLVAHVGDFGLSKILQSEQQNRHHSSSAGVRGTIGYAAPEYGLGSKVSRSGDMYSFGILLLEMITGKKPTDIMFGEGLSLHNYAKAAMSDGGHGIVDPALLNDDGKLAPSTNKEGTEETTGYMNKEMCLRLLLQMGVSCSMESPHYRMDTASVVQELQLIKDAISGNTTVSIPSV
ncbi:protein kinase domain-containing protein [Artemisia annua]|uniref:non-specific serine/threonine protein kinase n=1 Tax=Artemisia annua TaxID=35608 RepID=A0A2U1MX60_ARTAN|nr:protein kinase domain-containing protein [Artemisia annua]